MVRANGSAQDDDDTGFAMKKAGKGDRIKLYCSGLLENKAHLGKTKKRFLEFIIGEGSVLLGLEKGVIGMAAGEQKSFTVSPEEGYGARHSSLIQKISKNQFPDDVDLQVGKTFRLEYEDGSVQKVKIAAIEDDLVTVDANHPLAGETLRFNVEVIDIG